MQRRLRVLHIIDSLRLGGAQRLLADIVSRTDPDRFEFCVCCVQGGDAFRGELERTGVDTHILGAPKYSLAPATQLARICREGRFDVVHAHLFQGIFWGAYLRQRRIASRLIAHLHSPVMPGPWGPMEGWALRRADILIAVSAYIGDAQVARHHIPTARLRVIPNGIDLSRFQPGGRAAARVALGVALDAALVGFVGRLARVKGPDIMLDAFAKVRRDLPCAQLIVVGDGPQREALQGRCDTDGVSFVGSRTDVQALLPAFDLLCVPSRDETFGIAAVEAMACGVPVVAAAVGGLAEVVPPEAGALVTPEDATALAEVVCALLRDPVRRAAMSGFGPGHVRHTYAIGGVVRAIGEVYGELCP